MPKYVLRILSAEATVHGQLIKSFTYLISYYKIISLITRFTFLLKRSIESNFKNIQWICRFTRMLGLHYSRIPSSSLETPVKDSYYMHLIYLCNGYFIANI